MEKLNDTMTSDVNSLIENAIAGAYTYSQYRDLVAQHSENGTSTGPNQSEALSNYTTLSNARMRRLDKTTKVVPMVEEAFKRYDGNLTWLVLTESWCGDAAQSMPMMNKLAALAPSIDFKVILRDEHIELMNNFLTNGSMSIPKLIAIDTTTKEVVGDWGPRPSQATAMVDAYKMEHGSLSPEFKQDLQVWYNKDKSVNIAEDLLTLIQ